MRVLYFSRDYTPHDRRFLAALAQTEHQVAYLRLERGARQMEDRPLPPEIEQIPWAGGNGPARLWRGPQLLLSLRQVIARVQPDLIQAGPIQNAALLVALAGFRPLVATSWGSDLLRDAERNFWYRWATRFTLSRSAVLVGDCDPVRRQAMRFGMPEERIVTFPWGVDLRHFSPGFTAPEAPLPPELRANGHQPFILLSSRSWEPVYGVDVIARAFVAAARQRPELHLLMLGGGSQAAQLREIFRQGGVLERVHFLGQVKQDDLPRYYRAANLYLSASHSDGTSISLLEAMACGRPVLVSDIPGNREWVEPGVQGWWFPDGDPRALSEYILTAVAERENLAQMGLAARRLAEQRADWQRNFPHLLRAYELAYRVGRA